MALLCVFVRRVLNYLETFCCIWARTHHGHFLGLRPSSCSIIFLLTVAPAMGARFFGDVSDVSVGLEDVG